MIKYSLIVVT